LNLKDNIFLMSINVTLIGIVRILSEKIWL